MKLAERMSRIGIELAFEVLVRARCQALEPGRRHALGDRIRGCHHIDDKILYRSDRHVTSRSATGARFNGRCFPGRPSDCLVNFVLQNTFLFLAKRAAGRCANHAEYLLQFAGFFQRAGSQTLLRLGNYAVLDTRRPQIPAGGLRHQLRQLVLIIEPFDNPALPVMQFVLLRLAFHQLPFGDAVQPGLNGGDAADFAIPLIHVSISPQATLQMQY